MQQRTSQRGAAASAADSAEVGDEAGPLRRAPVRGTRLVAVPLLFSLCSSLLLLTGTRAAAQTTSLSLVTGSTLNLGSGVALGTTTGLYAPGSAFGVQSGPGAEPMQQALVLGTGAEPFFVPEVDFVFGSTFTITPIDEGGAPGAPLQLTLDLETGEIATGAGDPLVRVRIDEIQGFRIVNSDIFSFPVTTGTIVREQCGTAAPSAISGSPLDASGHAILIAAFCIDSLGASTGFNTPFLLKLEGDFGPPCADGIDNDGDTTLDFPGDPGCEDAADPSERDAGLVCDDGLDNDGDGLVDFPADPECQAPDDPSEEPDVPECLDGVDNDGDGRRDHPADPGCETPEDPSETSPDFVCDNGLDDDGDGLVDAADPSCLLPVAPTESAVCDDGIDNDGDGDVDMDDASCPLGWWHTEEDIECGLGGEIALALPLLLGLRRLRRRPAAASRHPGARRARGSRP
jgi:hypothetical protein